MKYLLVVLTFSWGLFLAQDRPKSIEVQLFNFQELTEFGNVPLDSILDNPDFRDTTGKDCKYVIDFENWEVSLYHIDTLVVKGPIININQNQFAKWEYIIELNPDFDGNINQILLDPSSNSFVYTYVFSFAEGFFERDVVWSPNTTMQIRE